MKVAVIGAGIAGIGTAWLLSPTHEVDVYEAGSYLGGHALTVDLDVAGTSVAADAGFMVFNRRTYPNILRFFQRLGVEWWENDMAFSVQVAEEGIEWSGRSYNAVFAQRKNIVNPRFLKMVADIVRFSRDADRLLADPSIEELTLGQLLQREGYSGGFTDWYLVPMGDAIWSTPPGEMLEYPAATFLRFADNHGLLHLTDRPTWMSLVGGSRTYVEAASKDFSGEVFLREPVVQVERGPNGVRVVTDERSHRYDAVVIATHPPETLGMLAEPTAEEKELLSRFAYSDALVTLHSDTSFMPKNHLAWASWNWFAESADIDKQMLCLTYYLNRLQKLGVETPVFETLNEDHPVDPSLLLERLVFEHPMFSREAIAAQHRLPTIQGSGGVYFAGAWTRYGFHEDGMLSAVRVAELLGTEIPWGRELDVARTGVLDPTPEERAAGVAAAVATGDDA